MQFVRGQFDENAKIRCLCHRCLNRKLRTQAVVEDHVYIHGMSSTYTRWVHHGEACNAEILEESEDGNATEDNVQHDGQDWVGVNEDDDDDDDDDGIPEMLGDLYTSTEASNGPMFARVLEEEKRELYAGCAKFSRFSFLVKLLHIKTYYWISNTTFTAILKLLSLALPACNELSSSYNEAKKYLRELGLGYDSIHVCKNNCVLFRKEYENKNNCVLFPCIQEVKL